MKSIRILAAVGMTLLSAAQASAQATEESTRLSAPLSELAVQPDILNALSAPSTAGRPARIITAEMRGKGAAAVQAGDAAADAGVVAAPPLSMMTFTGGTILNFDGNSVNGSAPSDNNGAVGTTQYVQWVNSVYTVYNKTTGAAVLGPVPGNTVFAGFMGSPGADACRLSNNGDPIAQYDKQANRWVLSQFAWLAAAATTGPFFQCIAVSTTSDATGTYNRYVFESRTAGGVISFPDYPKMGIWPDAYYITYVLFNAAGTAYLGPQICGYDRSAMLSGATAVGKCKDFGTAFGPLLPSDLDGTTPPPAGSPNFVMGFDFNNAGVGNILQFWKFSFTTNTLSAITNLTVPAFTIGCPATFGGACVSQATTTVKLDSLADRPMYRLSYRNFGGSPILEKMLLNHSIQQPTAAANGPLGIRVYEIRNPSSVGVPLVKTTTHAPDTTSRWMGSVAMDKKGNWALGYSASDGATFPGVRYTGRNNPVSASLLSSFASEATIIAGTGAQLGTGNRWGDYSSMSIDPVDDCTFWYTQQYIQTTGSFTWKTRIANFKFTTCI